MLLKNEIPWSGLFDLKISASPFLLKKIKDEFDSTNWGDNYENFRRPINQAAIYPATRTKIFLFSDNVNSSNRILKEIFEEMFNEIKHFFSEPMICTYGELTLMLPKSIIPWHYDGELQCSHSTRVMLPFLNNDDVDYYFSSWSENTPTVGFVSTEAFKSSSIEKTKIKTGTYCVFNHRVPHKTINNSLKSRGMVSINILPKSKIELLSKKEFYKYHPITEFEKSELIPIDVANK